MPPARPSVSLPFRGSRCARFDQARSQFVDGSIDHEAREELLRHLLGCPACRAEVTELRRIRSLLRDSRRDAADGTAAPDRLQQRLVSIAEGTEDDPLWSRPFRRVQAKPLPSPRRAFRRRAAAAATAFGTLVVTGAGVGYLAAPAAVGAIGDPTDSARAEFASARAELPLTADSATAVMMAGDRLPSSSGSATASLTPVSLTPAHGDQLGPSFYGGRTPVGSDALRYRPAASGTGRRLDQAQSVGWLDASGRAASTVSYSGIEEVVTTDGSVTSAASVTVEFSPAQGSDLTVSDLAGGEVGAGTIPTPTAAADALASMLAGHYRLSGLADVAVLGRRAAVVEARSFGSTDADPPSARWWIDQQTGLLLGRQTYDASGAVVQSAMLATLTTGGPQLAAHTTPLLAGSNATDSLAPAVASDLSAQGWSCQRTLAGLPLTDVRTDVAADPGLVHLVYTDGIWTVSVFERRGVLSGAPAGSTLDPGLGAYRTGGAPQLASWQSGDAVFTVATDGPDGLLTQVVRSLPHDPHRVPTTMGRVQAGWSRVVASMFG